MSFSYEEIRKIVLEILSGRERITYAPDQYEHLLLGVSDVIIRRSSSHSRTTVPFSPVSHNQLNIEEKELFREIFWDLFRQGIITLGKDDSNRNFPFFSLSKMGEKIIREQTSYFFHDVTSYTEVIKSSIPRINNITLIYLQEAMQAFQAGCLLSASVMIGVATEHTFLLMLDKIESNPTFATTYQNVFSQKTILPKINKFKNIFDQNLTNVPPDIKEDIDTHFLGILSIIRNFRNQSGHPSGVIPLREQTYVLLQLFIPYCKKLYQLIDYFS